MVEGKAPDTDLDLWSIGEGRDSCMDASMRVSISLRPSDAS